MNCAILTLNVVFVMPVSNMKRDGVQTYPETKSGYAMAKCLAAGKDLKITKCPAVRKFPRTSAKSLFLIV